MMTTKKMPRARVTGNRITKVKGVVYANGIGIGIGNDIDTKLKN